MGLSYLFGGLIGVMVTLVLLLAYLSFLEYHSTKLSTRISNDLDGMPESDPKHSKYLEGYVFFTASIPIFDMLSYQLKRAAFGVVLLFLVILFFI